jgi:hypothetical protein
MNRRVINNISYDSKAKIRFLFLIMEKSTTIYELLMLVIFREILLRKRGKIKTRTTKFHLYVHNRYFYSSFFLVCAPLFWLANVLPPMEYKLSTSFHLQNEFLSPTILIPISIFQNCTLLYIHKVF